MTDIVKTLERGELKVEIDHWGGVHWHHHSPPPLSISPDFMQEVEQARHDVINQDSDTDTNK